MKYLKPVFAITIVIGIYLIFIMNINCFFNDMENQIVSHENNFQSETNENNYLENILNSSEVDVATKEELDQILASPFLINIISQLLGLTEEETSQFITKYVETFMINSISKPEYDSKIIYFDANNSIFAFTLDGKNIFYNKYLSGESCYINNVSLNDRNIANIHNVESQINELFKRLKISQISDFSITSITHRGDYYSYSSGEVYEVEDSINHIRATYSLECYTLYSLNIGFKN